MRDSSIHHAEIRALEQRFLPCLNLECGSPLSFELDRSEQATFIRASCPACGMAGPWGEGDTELEMVEDAIRLWNQIPRV